MTLWMPDEEDKRIWVLDNNKIVEAPQMEISGGGRRVRLKDQPETSVWAKDRDSVIQAAVEDVARREKSPILTCTTQANARTGEEGQLPTPKIKEDEGKLANITLVWVFRHPTAPLYARVNVTTQKRYYRGGGYEVNPTITFDEMSPRSRHQRYVGEVGDQTWHVGGGDHYWSDTEREKREQLNAAKITGKLERKAYSTEREALRQLRDLMELFDSQISIDIPDVRTEKVKWVPYKFLRSNVDGEFVSDLHAYLDSEENILQAHEAYESLREALRRLGVLVPQRTQEDFARALTTQRDEALIIELPVENAEGKPAKDHEVFLHLASGTISICCDHQIDHEKTADEWKLARFEAEMRGELESFVGFHATKRTKQRQQIIEIAQERGRSKPQEAT